jgi:hypothetical protein
VAAGIEPAISGSVFKCSTTVPLPLAKKQIVLPIRGVENTIVLPFPPSFCPLWPTLKKITPEFEKNSKWSNALSFPGTKKESICSFSIDLSCLTS